MGLSALISKMVVFAVLIALGCIMAKKDILGPSFVKEGSFLLVNVFLSASILNSVIGTETDLSGADLTVAMLAVTLVIIITYAAAFLYSKLFKKDAVHSEMLMSVTNTLFVGMPAAVALCGDEAAFYIGISCVSYNLILFTYGVSRFRKGKGESGFSLKDLISPNLIAALLSLIVFLFRLPVPDVVKSLLSTASGATVPFSMIIIGATLGRSSILKAFSDKRCYLIALERLIIVPVITYFIIRLVTADRTLLISCTILAAVPVATSMTPLSVKFGYDAEYSARCIMVTTLLSIITIPILSGILFS